MSDQKNIGLQMIFCDEGLVLDGRGRYFQPEGTENIDGFIEIEVPKNPAVQFYGPQPGYHKIYVGLVDVLSLFDIDEIVVKPYERFNRFELRVLELAIKKELKVDFDKAKQLLSLQDLDSDIVNQNIQSSVAPKKVRKKIVGGTVKVPEGSACLIEPDEFNEWSRQSREVEGLGFNL